MKLNNLFEHFGTIKLAQNAEAVLPPVVVFPELDNSNSYLQYRFTTNLAAARAIAAGDVPFKKIVPWEQYLTVVGYTPEEIETVKLAAEQSGMKMEMLNTEPSHEPDWVNTKSPVMPFHMSEHKRKTVAKNAELFENTGKQVLVVYPGRFQPVHRGHSAVFNKLQEEFGSNVFMATSDKTEPNKSPFNFYDKSLMARAAGIPSDKFVQVKNPYSPTEITKLYDPNNTVLILVVGAKDMVDDPRFKFANKKDGSPSYLQKFKDIAVAEPMSKHGYIMEAPTVEFLVLGHPLTSATQVRDMYAKSDNVKRDRILKDLFEQNSAELRQLFDSKFGTVQETINESAHSDEIVNHMRNFLKIAKRVLQLDHLPKIIWTSSSTAQGERPTFGKFQNDNNTITVSIVNRHPIDIMRTVAHELTHYKQDITKGLNASSGDTGSPEEDEANAMAGRIMRHFNEKYPNAFETKPMVSEDLANTSKPKMNPTDIEASLSKGSDVQKPQPNKFGKLAKNLAIGMIGRQAGKAIAGPIGGIVGGAIASALTRESTDEEVWDKPNPVKTHKKLSAEDKAAAKRRAKAAGRKYPNMVDNIWAARR